MLGERAPADRIEPMHRRGCTGTFTIEPDTIPPGVRCGTCHRHLLPGAIAVEEVGLDGTGDQVVLAMRCPRCGVRGTAWIGGAAPSGPGAQVLEVLRAKAARAPVVHGRVDGG